MGKATSADSRTRDGRWVLSAYWWAARKARVKWRVESGRERRTVSTSGGRGWSGRMSTGVLADWLLLLFKSSLSGRPDGSMVRNSRFWAGVACRSAMRSTRVLLGSLDFGASRDGWARGMDGELDRAARRCFLFLGGSIVMDDDGGWMRRKRWTRWAEMKLKFVPPDLAELSCSPAILQSSTL